MTKRAVFGTEREGAASNFNCSKSFDGLKPSVGSNPTVSANGGFTAPEAARKTLRLIAFKGVYSMGFLDSYKRLEKLCGEVMNDDKRITAYIDEMNNTPMGSLHVSTWNEDLKKLKHYRWVRNQIAHNPDATEKNMTTSTDVKWIDDFYIRIMHQKDPLTLYHKAVRKRSVQKATASRKTTAKTPSKAPTRVPSKKSAKAPAKRPTKKKSGMPKGCATALVIVGLSALIAAAVVLLTKVI